MKTYTKTLCHLGNNKNHYKCMNHLIEYAIEEFSKELDESETFKVAEVNSNENVTKITFNIFKKYEIVEDSLQIRMIDELDSEVYKHLKDVLENREDKALIKGADTISINMENKNQFWDLKVKYKIEYN